MGHGHIFLDFPCFQVLYFEKANFVWKQVSKPRYKLLVKNKQHKQLIDRSKPDDVHFLVSNSSFLLPFWFIRRHFNQKFNHFSLSSPLKPAPGMSPGIRSTWSSAVLVISNFPSRAKSLLPGSFRFFFLTCHKQVNFFLESENYRMSSFLGTPFSLKKSSPARAKHAREQSCLRVSFLV